MYLLPRHGLKKYLVQPLDKTVGEPAVKAKVETEDDLINKLLSLAIK